jgi:hypothetical protein
MNERFGKGWLVGSTNGISQPVHLLKAKFRISEVGSLLRGIYRTLQKKSVLKAQSFMFYLANRSSGSIQ